MRVRKRSCLLLREGVSKAALANRAAERIGDELPLRQPREALLLQVRQQRRSPSMTQNGAQRGEIQRFGVVGTHDTEADQERGGVYVGAHSSRDVERIERDRRVAH